MSGVRVLVGTRKGAFILTSDAGRTSWDVSGPHFAGWEIYHVAGSPADQDRLYASQSSGWFGQLIQRSDDGGRTWAPGGNEFSYDGDPGTHQWYDGTPHPWEFARVWHLEPSLEDPDTVYAGVEDAGLFRSSDGGQHWQELPSLRGHRSGPSWQPGAGGMCLHTIILDPHQPGRMFTAISAAGAFRSDDAGESWRPINHGLRSDGIPDPEAEVGHCVHRLAMHPSRPGVLYMQKHWDVMRSDDAGESWREVSGDLPTDFGFPIAVHAHEPEHRLRGPHHQRLPPFPARGQAARLPQPDRRGRMGAADPGPAAGALLCQRAARRDGRGHPGRLRDLLRHHRRAGVRLGRRGGPLAAGRPGPARRPVRRGPNAVMIRVVLPAHLRALADAGGEVELRVPGPVTQRAVLDALEARYPVLRGTIRDHRSGKRRAFVRFFACQQDLSHQPPDEPLPAAVAAGAEPYLIVGAMAGG